MSICSFNCWPGGCEPTPSELSNFDAIEIGPIQDLGGWEEGETQWTSCDPEDAEMWTIYLHYKKGGVLDLHDIETYKEACEIALQLSEKWGLPVACGVDQHACV